MIVQLVGVHKLMILSYRLYWKSTKSQQSCFFLKIISPHSLRLGWMRHVTWREGYSWVSHGCREASLPASFYSWDTWLCFMEGFPFLLCLVLLPVPHYLSPYNSHILSWVLLGGGVQQECNPCLVDVRVQYPWPWNIQVYQSSFYCCDKILEKTSSQWGKAYGL